MLLRTVLFLAYYVISCSSAISNCEYEVDGFCEICKIDFGISWDGSKCLDNSKYVDKCMIYESDDATCHTCVCGYGLTLPANKCNIDMRTDAIEEKGCSTFDKDKKCTFCRPGFTLTVKSVCIPETDVFAIRGCAVMSSNNRDCSLCHQDWGLVKDDGNGRQGCVDIDNDFEFANQEQAIWPNMQSVDTESDGIKCQNGYFFVKGFGCEVLPQYCLLAYKDNEGNAKCLKCNVDSVLLESLTCTVPDPVVYDQFEGCVQFSDDLNKCIKCPEKQVLVAHEDGSYHCMDEIANCVQYSTFNLFCRKCAQFYSLSADRTVCYPNFYKNTVGCAKLRVHDNNQCEVCDEEHNFQLTLSKTACQCKSGFTLSAQWGETCVETASQNIANCVTYFTEDRCASCQTASHLTYDKTACSDPSQVPHCVQLIGSFQELYCYQCEEGYGRLPSGQCLSYDENENVTDYCFVFLNNAGDACRECISGYTLDENGLCQQDQPQGPGTTPPNNNNENCTDFNSALNQCNSCNEGYHLFQLTNTVLCNQKPLITYCILYVYDSATDDFTCIDCLNDVENTQRVPNVNQTICLEFQNYPLDLTGCVSVNDTDPDNPCIECEDNQYFLTGDFALDLNTDLCVSNSNNLIENCLEYAEVADETPLLQRCTTCKPSYFAYFAMGTSKITACRPYITDCARAFIDDDTQLLSCHSCNNDKVYNDDHQVCMEVCSTDPGTHYLQNVNYECFPAHPFCLDQPYLDFCIQCEYPFGMVGARCRLLPPGCAAFSVNNDNLQCEECLSGFGKDENGDCVPIEVDNCLVLLDSTHCSQCFNESFGLLSNRTDCLDTIPNCINYTDENVCLKCNEKNSVLFRQKCLQGCATLNAQKTQCIECLGDYTLVNNNCVLQTVDKRYKNCLVFQSGICMECELYYGLKEGLCVKEIIVNCLVYNADNTCSACVEGYTLANNYCFLNIGPCKMEMCAEYPNDFSEGNFQCSKCDPQYHIYKYRCKKGVPTYEAILVYNYFAILSLIVLLFIISNN